MAETESALGPPLGAELELTVDRLVAGGNGLSFVDGVAVFVSDAAAGDRARVRIVERKSDYARAELLELLTPGAGRRTPPCAVANRCGGCSLQHLEYDTQVEAKRAILAESFKRVGGIELPTEIPLHRSPEWGFRLRAELKVARAEGKPQLGYYARRSHELVRIPGCPILGPGFAKFFTPFVKLLNERGFLFYGLEGVVYLEGDEGAVILLEFRKEPEKPGPLFEALRWLSMEAGLIGAAAKGPEGVRLNWGKLAVTMKLDERSFLMEPGAFVQTNRTLAPELWRHVRDIARTRKERRALDLYGGAGFFALALADHFHESVTVEANVRAAKLGRENLARNHVTSVRAVAAPVASFLEREGERLRESFVVVDPPRHGLEPDVRKLLAAKPPAALLYVSCDAVTLARDLKSLAAGGLALHSVAMFDLFPHTAHFETVVLLERAERA